MAGTFIYLGLSLTVLVLYLTKKRMGEGLASAGLLILAIFTWYMAFRDEYFLSGIGNYINIFGCFVYPIGEKLYSFFLTGLFVLLSYSSLVFLKRRAIPAAMAGLLAAVVILAGHAAALAVTVLFFCIAFLAGSLISKLTDALQLSVDPVFVRLFAGVCAVSYLFWVMSHFQVNNPVVHLLLLLIIAIVFRKEGPTLISVVRSVSSIKSITPGQTLLAVAASVHLFYMLVPNYTWDALNVHLYIPKVIALNGAFDYLSGYTTGLFSEPMLIIGAQSPLMVLGGEYSIRLFLFIMFYGALFMFESYTRRALGEKASFFATAVAVSSPVFLFSMANCFADPLYFYSAFLLTALWMQAVISPSPAITGLLLVISALAFLGKAQSIFVSIPACISAVAFCSFKRSECSLKSAAGLFALSVLLVLPLFARNWMLTGNPTFPFFQWFFRSPLIPPGVELGITDVFKSIPLNTGTLFDITFKGEPYRIGAFNNFKFGAFFFVFAFLLPLLFVKAGVRRKAAFLLFMFATILAVCYTITDLDIRYLMVLTPAGAMLTGLIMKTVLEPVSAAVKSIAVISFFMVFAFNITAQVNDTALPMPFPVFEAFTKDYSRSPRLAYYQLQKDATQYASAVAGREGKLLLHNYAGLYFADVKAETADHYNYNSFRQLRSFDGPMNRYAVKIFRELGFNVLVLDQRHNQGNEGFGFLPSYGYAKRIYSAGDLDVFVPNWELIDLPDKMHPHISTQGIY